MPRIKVQRKSTFIDMTAMCDVASLLLTFFILTSNFTQKEPVLISTPSSISDIKIPETNIMMILVSKEGQVFFGIDGQEKRKELLEKVSKAVGISYSSEEEKKFSLMNNFGVPLSGLRKLINEDPAKRDSKEYAQGIPIDSLHNEFKTWVQFAKSVNPKLTIAIKADQGTPYPAIKRVMDTLQELHENRFNLITSLETAPDNI